MYLGKFRNHALIFETSRNRLLVHCCTHAAKITEEFLREVSEAED